MVAQARNVVSAVLIAALLAGCATLPEGQVEESNPEREIFIEALMAGVAAGGALGAAAGYHMAGKKNQTEGALIGGLVGAVAGALVASVVAEQQIRNLRDYQLDNRRMQALLDVAEKRNREAVEYNRQLEREIVALRKKDKAVRGQIASAKLKEARQKKEAIQRAVADRQDLAGKLVSSQRAQYERTLGTLKREDQRLDRSIKHLERMETPVVGGAKTAGSPLPRVGRGDIVAYGRG